MKINFYLACCGAIAIALSACSSDNGTDASANEPAPIAEISSSSIAEQSSSSLEPLSLCKINGDWGGWGCIQAKSYGEGDLMSEYDRKVKTDIYIDSSTKFGNHAGEFFFETDSIEGGKTRIFFGPDSSPESDGVFAANYQLNRGNSTKDPYLNIGFYIAGFDSSGNLLSADISNWNGICMLYRGSIDPVLQLDLGDSLNKKLGYALPSVTVTTIKINGHLNHKPPEDNKPLCYEWKQFKQPDIEGEHEIISGEEAAKHVARIIFRLESKTDVDKGYFYFLAIGTNRDE